MENKVLISRAIRYQKTASDNMFSILTTLQSGGEKMVEETLNQCSWFPESGRKGLVFWYDTCTKTTNNFKQMIDQSYEEVQKYFDISVVQSQAVEKTVQPAASTVKKASAVPARKKQPAKTKPAAAKINAVEATQATTEKAAPVKTGTAKRSTARKPATAKKPGAKTTAATKAATTDKVDKSKGSAEPQSTVKTIAKPKSAAKTSAKVTGAEKKAPMYNKPEEPQK